MTKTEHYNLNQWDAGDRVLREDFNSDNEKIDAAIAAEATVRESAVATLSDAVSKRGNCRIVSKTYKGTGTYGSDNKNTVTFDAPPLLVFIGGYDGHIMCLFPGYSHAKLVFASAESSNYISWSGNNVSWYSAQDASCQFNAKNTTYYVVAFFAMD